jgi:hypothetical protein
MKMPSYLENQAEAHGHLVELEVDPRANRACTLGCNITAVASMPQEGITMKIKLEVILKQQLAVQADRTLEIIVKSLNPVTGSQMIMREQKAAGVCYLCAKHGHISVDCPRLKMGGPQNEVERIGSWYGSTVNMQNLPKLYEIRNRKKPILDPGATMHQRAGTGTWRHDAPRNTQKQHHKKVARNKHKGNWQGSTQNDTEAVDQLFRANKVEIKQKMLKALRLLRKADHALDEVCKYFNNLTEDV